MNLRGGCHRAPIKRIENACKLRMFYPDPAILYANPDMACPIGGLMACGRNRNAAVLVTIFDRVGYEIFETTANGIQVTANGGKVRLGAVHQYAVSLFHEFGSGNDDALNDL